MSIKRYVAIDQHGQCIRLNTEHPRKELLRIFGYANCSKMYRDITSVPSEGATGSPGSRHVGYVIGQHWIEIFEIIPFKLNEENSHERTDTNSTRETNVSSVCEVQQ